MSDDINDTNIEFEKGESSLSDSLKIKFIRVVPNDDNINKKDQVRNDTKDNVKPLDNNIMAKPKEKVVTEGEGVSQNTS